MYDLTTLEDIKATVPVTYVLHLKGHEPHDQDGRDIRYLTPWRQDRNPSLACFADEDGGVVDRWKDMSRANSGGDILDLIEALDPKKDTYSKQYDLALKIYDRYLEEDDWVEPEPGVTGSFDIEASRAEVMEWELQSDRGSLADWLRDRTDTLSDISARWLTETFGVVWIRGEVRAPYGDTGLYKYRRPGDKFQSPSGTRRMWGMFYGEWLDTDPSLPVVLCEGETDVWSGTHATQDYVFFGLPTGAGTNPKKMQTRLAGRRVLIATDQDSAGRDAARLWADELSKDNEVFIVPLPEGQDLADVRDIPALLAAARRYERPLRGIGTLHGRYFRLSKDGAPGMEISDFVMTPNRVLQGVEGGLSYVVLIDGIEHDLLSRDLRNDRAFHDWAHNRGLVWSGSKRDTEVLASELKAASVFCPHESAADTTGVFDRHLVWADGSIGDRSVRFIPNGPVVNYDIHLSEPTGPAKAKLIPMMRRMGPHSVMDPILAWAAVAPFRSFLPQFPILNISGSAGSGKTTLIQTVIPMLTGSNILQTLTGTTPFGIEALIHNTNAFPVVFDEYRGGARNEAMTRLQQLVRDAYNGSPSVKSKGGDRWNELAETRTMAPLVIAGEQSFEEKSHGERMVIVNVPRPKGGRDANEVKAYHIVRQHMDGELAYSYMRWVVAEMQEHDMPVSVPEADDRMSYNLGVLDLGWRALNDYLGRCGLPPMEDPDWSGVVDVQEEMAATNPVVDAIDWALGDKFLSESVWITEDDELCVQAGDLVAAVNRAGVITLPGGNATTIVKLLQSDYGAVQKRLRNPVGDRKVVQVMALEDVLPGYGVD